MPSNSLITWKSSRLANLDEIEQAHRSVGGHGPGRRYATQQINQAYAVLLSSHFQGFCRDLHTECVDFLMRFVTPVDFRSTMRTELLRDRKLDKGNPSPGNIGSDFNRMGIDFWSVVQSTRSNVKTAQHHLEDLNNWRNAIAHQDFDVAKFGTSPILRLAQVRTWRAACDRLAEAFEFATGKHLSRVPEQSHGEKGPVE